MQLFDVKIDFFIPLWRRVLLVAFCGVWALFEFANGAIFWGLIVGALGIYALWQLFFDGWPGSQDNVIDPDQ